MRRSIEICKRRKPDINKLTVNSSPNAVKAYRKMGFKGIRDERVVNGICFIPMEFSLVQKVNRQPVVPPDC